MKWTDADFAAAPEGQMPLGQFADEWTVGDVEAELKNSALVIDRTWVGSEHEPPGPRAALRDGLLAERQAAICTPARRARCRRCGSIARWVGIDAKDVVLISEYTGGGFGSRIPGYIAMAIPALLSKKANAPVHDAHHARRRALHRPRASGAPFARQGRLRQETARSPPIDLFVVTENGPFDQVGDGRSAGDIISLAYQPKTMRWRGVNVLTNTPPRGAQRAPGGMQGIAIMEPILAEAGRKLGIDEVEIHQRQRAGRQGRYGPAAARGRRNYVTSAFVKEALDKGAEIFKWERRRRAAASASVTRSAEPVWR